VPANVVGVGRRGPLESSADRRTESHRRVAARCFRRPRRGFVALFGRGR
jgi:hypothetical protein